MILFDRQGKEFDFAPDEVEAMLTTGIYFRGKDEKEAAIFKPENPAGKSKMITIYEKATGKALQRRPVDAYELVRTGKYAFTGKYGKPAKPKEPENPQGGNQEPQGNQNSKEPEKQDALPVLTEENSKQEITEALQRYGVQFRANMDKESLLTIWNNYLLEQGQK